MSLQVEKLEKNMAKLTIEVPASDLEKALQSAYKKQKNKISLPGFRKGKVPRQMIEKMYGAEIFFDDAANEIIPKAYADAYDECELEIVSRPEINIVQIEKGKPFIFTAEVATKPEVTLGEYKGLEVDKVSTRVTQKEVEAKIEEEAEKNARTVTVEDRAVQDGDEVILDFEGFVDGEAFEGGKGENYPLTIGSGSFIPGFEEQLVGAEAEKEVEVKVTFPEDYHAEELKGKENLFFSQEAHGILEKSCLKKVSFQETKTSRRISPAALYTMQYIVTVPMTRLFGFTVTEEVLWELEHHIQPYVSANTDKRFKSLQILEAMI